MAKISLKSITDDILLLVRNNNISESEDLSRAQIHEWVKAYRKKIWKDEKDAKKELARLKRLTWEDLIDDEFVQRIESGPLQLEFVRPDGFEYNFVKRTIDPIEGVMNNDPSCILAIYDENGENIQYMNKIRRNYAYWRKYTFGDMTAFYKDDGRVYIQGLTDQGRLEYIYVEWLKEVEDEDLDEDNADDEESVKIPAWMVPTIKKLILENELKFMLNRPSDDKNNSSLSSVKPEGPQYEK